MSEATPEGPDLSAGIAADKLEEGQPLLGHAGKDAVLLTRFGADYSAVSAICSHYHGALAAGLVVGETVRCPLHHACFSLRNGEVLAAPGLSSLSRWEARLRGDKVYVEEKLPPLARSAHKPPLGAKLPASIVIVGGGAAGEAAATTLRFSGYEGPVTIVSAEDGLPPDRPNLSKDYLSGSAPREWIPVRGEAHYRDNDIEFVRNTRITTLDATKKIAFGTGGREFRYGALLLATGADPVRLTTAGSELPHVHYLRTAADSDAIIATVERGPKCAVVIGASFIGLEVAASLRARDVEVHIVAPEARPLERVLGPQLGDLIRTLHERKGVKFHLGRTVAVIDSNRVRLSDGAMLAADLVIAGIGVRPAVELAEQVGIALDRGVPVNEYLETRVPGIFAAGDIARWPDPRLRSGIRVEHWAVAQRQGQTAARNMLGYRERFTAVPFFWSQHYDVTVNYVGHAEQWDCLEVNGDPARLDCAVDYKLKGRLLARATIGRDRASLETEARLETMASG